MRDSLASKKDVLVGDVAARVRLALNSCLTEACALGLGSKEFTPLRPFSIDWSVPLLQPFCR
jgi:hypothetical protein